MSALYMIWPHMHRGAVCKGLLSDSFIPYHLYWEMVLKSLIQLLLIPFAMGRARGGRIAALSKI